MPKTKSDTLVKEPKKKYRGELARPFRMPLVKYHADMKAAGSNQVEKLRVDAFFNAQFEKEIDRRMGLLLDEYGIDRQAEDRWAELAEALAFEHVPGFDFTHEYADDPRTAGAPKKWDKGQSLELIGAVHEARHAIAKKKGIKFGAVTTRDACRRLLKDYPSRWPARGGGSMSPENLQKRYDEARKRTTALQQLMRQPKNS